MAEKEGLITYENLYDILRREKMRPELQKLNENFFTEVLEYLNNKKAILDSQQKKESIFASAEVEKTRTEMKSIKKILKDIYEKRESKILQQVLISSRNSGNNDTSGMLPEEQIMFRSLLDQLNLYRTGILFNVLQCTLPDVKKPKDLKIGSEKEDSNTLKIQIISDMPEFVGPDLNAYGPFKKDDIQEFPADVGEHLINNKQGLVIR